MPYCFDCIFDIHKSEYRFECSGMYPFLILKVIKDKKKKRCNFDIIKKKAKY